MKPDDNNLGRWNAYVEKGKTSEIRKARLVETPEHLRADVKRHAQTVYALKNTKH